MEGIVLIENFMIARALEEEGARLRAPLSLAPGKVYSQGLNYLALKYSQVATRIQAMHDPYEVSRRIESGELEELEAILNIRSRMMKRVKDVYNKVRTRFEQS